MKRIMLGLMFCSPMHYMAFSPQNCVGECRGGQTWWEQGKMFTDLTDSYSSTQPIQQEIAVMLMHQNFEWQEGDTVLDVGCGTGEISKYVAQQDGVKSVEAFDVSPDMVRHARKNSPHEKVAYHIADARDELAMKLVWEESFTKAVCFNVLHWIEEKERVIRNVFSTLKHGGEFLFSVSAGVPAMTVARGIIEYPKWKDAFAGFTYPVWEWPKGDAIGMQKLLEDVGFEVITCVNQVFTVKFESDQEEKMFLRPLLSHLEHIPAHLHDEFLMDFIYVFYTFAPKDENQRAIWEFPFVVAHVRK
ncbi:juvenile hormone acid O-methyltransferase-like [Branchiostoma floridae x Branchiostoma belcheri]